jgi:putative transposase
MPYNPEIHHRKSVRLKGYDYSRAGLYFITVCAYKHGLLFGDVVGNKMCLNENGEFVNKCWQEISNHYPNVVLDEFVIMPNHIHGIIQIIDNNTRIQNNQNGENVGAQNIEPLQPKQNINKYQHIIPGSIGAIIRGFKIGVTKWFRQNTDIYTVWQRNYHEHIIRNEKEFYRIKNYIRQNPIMWSDDRYYQ